MHLIRIAIPIPLVTGASLQKITLHIKLDNDDYNKKCLLHQVLIQQNMYIVVLDKISHLQVKMVAIVT